MATFYEQCGDLENLIIVVKTSKGKVVGGFTTLSLNPPGNKWIHKKNA
jgi:hypothetical protein